MATVPDWIQQNHEWFFSGLGVFILGGLIALVRLAYGHRSNHPNIAIHSQNIDLQARDFHEEYDHALGIFIANTGDSPIHIQRALFRDRVPFLLVFRRISRVPVYKRAFRDMDADAYELKFGDQWYDPQTDIPARGRVMTYLPLLEPIEDENTNKRKHGQVLLEYSSQGSSGIHRTWI